MTIGGFCRTGSTPEAAADLLEQMGVTLVIAQSRFLPMADSAVESAVRQVDKDRYPRSFTVDPRVQYFNIAAARQTALS